MDHQKRSLRLGAALILCALVLRLGSAGFFRSAADFLGKPNIAAFLIYLETGRKVRFSPSTEPVEVFARESAIPDFAKTVAVTEPAEKALPVFAPQDADTVKFKNNSGRKFDAGALVTEPLQWDLTAGAPAVLILHTHATESYTRQKGEDYQETSAFRTLSEEYNMICVGDHLTELLEGGGVTVLHDRKLHDYPSYNGSYSNARKAITQYLKENPSICMVLDLHRDASGDNKRQMRTVAEVDGKVVGHCGVTNIVGEGEITNVAVLAEYRGRGLAREMLSRLLAEGEVAGITDFTLEVRAGNAAAIHLYESLGFLPEGVRPGFYDNPREDALIMWKRQAG